MVSRITKPEHDEPGPKPSRRKRAARMTISVMPTLFTLANLLSGFVAIFLASRPIDTPLPFGWSPLTFAALAIFMGMIFDSLDGRIARMANATSELGEQLDSMADMVTFGVAPAIVAVMLVRVGTPFLAAGPGDQLIDRAVLIAAGLYVVCAALRLARFNIEIGNPETSDHMSFKGLPSPGAAGALISLVLIHEHVLAKWMRTHDLTGDQVYDQPWSIWFSKVGMIAVMALVALAMVSKLRYIHVLNRYVRGQASFYFIVACVLVLALASIHLQYTMAAALVLYALSAPAAWCWYKLFGKSEDSKWFIVEDAEDGEETDAVEAD